MDNFCCRNPKGASVATFVRNIHLGILQEFNSSSWTNRFKDCSQFVCYLASCSSPPSMNVSLYIEYKRGLFLLSAHNTVPSSIVVFIWPSCLNICPTISSLPDWMNLQRFLLFMALARTSSSDTFSVYMVFIIIRCFKSSFLFSWDSPYRATLNTYVWMYFLTIRYSSKKWKRFSTVKGSL